MSEPKVWGSGLRWVQRLALSPFPSEFRHRFGQQIVETLWARLTAARQRGRWSAIRCAVASGFDLVAAGLAERRAARRQRRGSTWGAGLRSEAAVVMRSLVRRPLLSVTIVVTLGLGIAAVTTAAGWVWGVLLHPLAGVSDQSSLVAIETTTREGDFIDASYLDYLDLAKAGSLTGAIAFREEPLAVRLGDQTQRLWSQQVSSNYFALLDVQPALGRFFGPAEESAGPGGAPVAVISHDLWGRVFGSDGTVLGRTLVLNRQTFTIIGVAPPEFLGATVGLAFDVWIPVLERTTLEGGYAEWHEDRGSRPLHLLGRLADGVTIAMAQQDLAVIGERLQNEFADTNRGISYSVMPIAQAPYGAQSVLGSMLWSLMLAAGLVTLIVIANVSNLLLAGETARRRDAAIRIALGAGGWRVARQLMLRAGFLALAASLVSIVAAPRLNGLLAALLPVTQYHIVLQSAPIGLVMALSGSLALVCGLLLGSLPLLGRGRIPVTMALKDGGSRVAGGRHLIRAGLVVAEVTLAFVAASGAGVLLDNYHQLKQRNPGFDPSGVLLAAVDTRGSDYDTLSGPLAIERTLESLRSLPGVAGAVAAERVPLGFGRGSWDPVAIEGYGPTPDENMRVEHNTITPGYFEMMGVELIAGREYNADDNLERENFGLIVNQAFVDRWLEGREPLSTKVRLRGRDHIIIGVVPDIKLRRLDEEPFPYMYFALAQDYQPNMGLALHVRTAVPENVVIQQIQTTLRSVAPGLLVAMAMPLSDFAGAATFAERVGAVILGCLGTIAVLLAALGLYALMNVVVSERTTEIGVRAALGARRGQLLRMVIGRGMRTTLVGLLLGALFFGWAAGRLSQTLGAAVPQLAVIGLLAAAVLGLVALLAIALPALRASRIHPLLAMRSE